MAVVFPPINARTRGTVIDFVRRVLPVLVLSRATVTSWYRDAATNLRVRGAPRSQHLFGGAMDLVGTDGQLDLAARVAQITGLVPVREADHLHVQLFQAGDAPPWLFDR